MTRKKAAVTALFMALLAGCGGGVEWFPPPPPADSTATVYDRVETVDVGTLEGAERNGDRTYTTRTSKGVFTTMSSLSAPLHSKVELQSHYDPKSSLLIGQMLRDGNASVLVMRIVAQWQ